MNSFGQIFKVQIFGESHGSSIGLIIDHCPAGIPISESDFSLDLQRRKSGALGTTQRIENDEIKIGSGVFDGHTTGAPICLSFENHNTQSKDYSTIKEQPRPGHSDFTASKKFSSYNDYRGGGHFSGRLTLALVAAGVVAKKICSPMLFQANIIELGGTDKFDEILKTVIQEQDSIGGLIRCTIDHVPVGLGEPFFQSIESHIAQLAFAIPAIKGIDFGSGFAAASMRGSQHNDPIVNQQGGTVQNNSGGINGGLSNGNQIVFRLAVKPTSSIAKTQYSQNLKTNSIEKLEIEGRHDACIALRVPVVAEAIAAIALADLVLLHRSRFEF
ncbi:MAG TPA: chorismate synthase [Saprospiraceae bacterium]|nr:chorismate synthase [Saprospiraceae bacterium]